MSGPTSDQCNSTKLTDAVVSVLRARRARLRRTLRNWARASGCSFQELSQKYDSKKLKEYYAVQFELNELLRSASERQAVFGNSDEEKGIIPHIGRGPYLSKGERALFEQNKQLSAEVENLRKYADELNSWLDAAKDRDRQLKDARAQLKVEKTRRQMLEKKLEDERRRNSFLDDALHNSQVKLAEAQVALASERCEAKAQPPPTRDLSHLGIPRPQVEEFDSLDLNARPYYIGYLSALVSLGWNPETSGTRLLVAKASEKETMTAMRISQWDLGYYNPELCFEYQGNYYLDIRAKKVSDLFGVKLKTSK